MIRDRRLCTGDRLKCFFKEAPLEVGETAGVYIVAESVGRPRLRNSMTFSVTTDVDEERTDKTAPEGGDLNKATKGRIGHDVSAQ
jgi:hypothetical protein